MKSATEAGAVWLASVPVYPLTAAQRLEEWQRLVRESRQQSASHRLYKVLA